MLLLIFLAIYHFRRTRGLREAPGWPRPTAYASSQEGLVRAIPLASKNCSRRSSGCRHLPASPVARPYTARQDRQGAEAHGYFGGGRPAGATGGHWPHALVVRSDRHGGHRTTKADDGMAGWRRLEASAGDGSSPTCRRSTFQWPELHHRDPIPAYVLGPRYGRHEWDSPGRRVPRKKPR